jgi:hypothetical protein
MAAMTRLLDVRFTYSLLTGILIQMIFLSALAHQLKILEMEITHHGEDEAVAIIMY